MTHQVMRLANQLFAGKTTDLNKGIVAVSDIAVQISGGNKPLILGKGVLSR